MKLTRLTAGTTSGKNNHHGKVMMNLECKNETERDAMVGIINRKELWENSCPYCPDDDSEMSWVVDHDILDDFKADYMKAKKELK